MSYIAATPELNPSLNWDRLSSSSHFSLIQFFAELDETLSLFTLKAVKKLAEGLPSNRRLGNDYLRHHTKDLYTIPAVVQWGVLPFINDMKAIAKTLTNMSTNAFDYADVKKISHNKVIASPWSYEEFSLGIQGKISVHGVGSLIGVSDLDILLDRLGLHPDLQTAWDLVPYSFLINDAFAVADALDSMWPRGHVRSMPFNGWASIKYDVELEHRILDGHSYTNHCTDNQSSFEIYQRLRYHHGELDQLPPLATSVDFIKAPSVKTVLNSLYLLSLKVDGR